MTDRLDRLTSLQAPLATSPGKGRCSIVMSTYESAKMHEHIVAPNVVWETDVEPATFVGNEPSTLADLSLYVG